MLIPSSTYRIQLNDAFTFRDLAAIVPYLHELGVSTIYASPITTATKGSQHGYDVTDALKINPEIGNEEQLQTLAGTLHSLDMSWLQDIVPNHMAYDPANPWLYDVLKKGPDSPYYGFFDIMAGQPESRNTPGAIPGERLMAPFLGADLSDCLEKGEFSLQHTARGFVIRYYDKDYPVTPQLYDWVTARIAFINQKPELLGYLLDHQFYSLTNARLASSQINYRRFFTINGLICLSMEKPEVFSAWHQTLHRWYGNGWINGLRVDHIDGLADPKTYLQRLREHFGQDCYVVAEKILTEQETLPDQWPLEGTTGYDFLATANQLLTDTGGSRELLGFYLEKIIELNNYKTLVYERKLNFLCRYMGGELAHLRGLLTPDHAAVDPGRLKEALAVWMASFPVYRAYPDEQGVSPSDRTLLIDSMAAAKDRRPDLLPQLDILAGHCDYDDSEAGRRRFHFLNRLMQWTGPLAAKGIEDTVFYVYNPYISHCEVGDSPGIAGIPAHEFHRRMLDRRGRWPHTLNATSTHDTKRGEDSRIRLSFLSAIPREWIDAVVQWRRLNHPLITQIGGRAAPSPNDEYLIYQSLLGGFPENGIVTDDFRRRFAAWLLKALREAKTETNYDEPDEAYEGQCQTFVSTILKEGSAFLAAFRPFAQDVIRRSATYSLSQLLLKLTAPGIPDIYQGAELWELSFVDPDNRRPVDFGLRSRLLQQIKSAEEQGVEAVFDLLHRHRVSGIDKLFTLYRVLHCRRQQLLLFADGAYIPVSCEGPLLAYLRQYGDDWALVAVPLLPTRNNASIPVTMTLPADAPGEWTDVFTGTSVHTENGIPSWPEGLPTWPVILLTGSTTGE